MDLCVYLSVHKYEHPLQPCINDVQGIVIFGKFRNMVYFKFFS
jgi:hypothetical protein